MAGHKKKFEISPKLVFVILIVLCIGLIIVSVFFKDKIAPVKSAVGNVLVPMQKGIDKIGGGISNSIKRFSDINSLIEENNSLKAELDNLKSENQMLTQEKYELNWYRDLYELDSVYSDYHKLAARVISRDPDNYDREFIIDKGTDDGMCVDMNVLSGNGLVGLIVETGKNWSKVRTIVDDSSSVSGMFLTTSDTCIVNGNNEHLQDGYIDVEMIDMDAEVYDNYEVVTSYISEKYLPGILVGYISNIRNDARGMSKNADLTPAVDFDHIEAVLVITTLREKLEGINE